MPNPITSLRTQVTANTQEVQETKPALAVAEAPKAAEKDAVATGAPPKPLAEAPRANVSANGSAIFRHNIEAQLESGRIGNKPEVARVLLTYFPNKAETVSRPAERLLNPIAFMDTELRKAKTRDEAIDIAGSSDFRRRVFTLEGGLKMYRGDLGKKIDEQYANVKKLEDLAGGFSYAQTMLKTAKDVGAPAATVAHLEQKLAAAREALGKLIDEQLTLDHKGQYPALKSLVRDIRHAEFGSYNDDRKELLKVFKKSMKEIEESEYDMNDLENGIHELRRQLRWVTIYTEAVDGLIQHDKTVEPVMPDALADPVATSKYMTMPAADRELKPVTISTSLYAKQQKIVLDLGAIKDRGEAIHGLRDALVASGDVKDAAEGEKKAIALLKLTPEQADLVALAKPLYAEIQSGGWFKQLRKQLSGD